MPCIHPPRKDKVKEIKEESFIKEGRGKLKVTIEGEEKLETVINGSLKDVEDVADMLGVDLSDGRIDTVVDGVKIKMERETLELEFENGERMRLERIR